MQRMVCALRLSTLIGGIAFWLLLSAHANAGGFQNITQSAAASAVATAGEAAIAEDGATIFYNPAGMARLERPQALAATGIGFPQSSFQNRGSIDALGNPVFGTNNVGRHPSFVPSFYTTTPI